MGVPAFFRWLSRKYASVVVPCIEEKSQEVDGEQIPVDSSQPNPNRIEFDNLYLDMNGIIHPCTHPEDKPAPKDEEEMMVAIFEAIDRLFRIVRPRKLLYMAIDGIAPRAKMNQQRSRRFRASKEIVEKVEEINRLRSELATRGAHLPPEKPKESHFDSNCITPGTPFMARLSVCLHYYIHSRLNTDPGWRGIKVILSDANVPGEGEHKIMDYIRKQRSQPDHDPNTQHCLCGADADLIMLGLATHEPNFTIIREEFKPNKPRPCEICGQIGHEMKDCLGLPSQDAIVPQAVSCSDEFIFVRLSILREYLERELDMPNLPFDYDFERAIDDWVFMCFFVGNDFLPHLPSLEIREGAIDRLVSLYKKTVYKSGGYITDSGDVNLDRVQLIMNDLGAVEDEIFKKRQQNEISFRAREKAKQKRMRMGGRPSFTPQGQFAPRALGGQVTPISNLRQEAFNMRKQAMHHDAQVERQLGMDAQKGLASLIEPLGNKRKSDQRNNEEEEEEQEPQDEVRLWEDGFKDRYYESKFDADPDNLEFRYRVAEEYIRGLCWVLRYYYQGCASWKWYFPYHYAPFASDFINVSSLSTEFEKGTLPFRPLEQLMGVFPAASSKHVPQPWAKLMHEPDSPIIDFYPEDFKIDLNGKKYAWQGVALLPFVDEIRLFKALEDYYPLLTSEEVKRNIRGDDRLYVMPGNKHGFQLLSGLYSSDIPLTDEVEICIDGMRGAVLSASDYTAFNGFLNSPINYLPTVENNQVVCVRYRDPKYPDTFIFPAKRLKGAKKPDIVLKPSDLNRTDSQNWRVQVGMGPATQRAHLSTPGHRFVGHYSGSNRPPSHSQSYGQSQQNSYNIAPHYSGSNRSSHSQSYGQSQQNRNNSPHYSGSNRRSHSQGYGQSQQNSYNIAPHYSGSNRSSHSQSYGQSQQNRNNSPHYSGSNRSSQSQSYGQSQQNSYNNAQPQSFSALTNYASQMHGRGSGNNFRQNNRHKYTGQSRPYNPQQRRQNRSN